MIKVLEYKSIPKAKIRCSNCNSLLEYSNADLNSNLIGRLDTFMYSSPNYFLICPVCGCNVFTNWIIKNKEND